MGKILNTLNFQAFKNLKKYFCWNAGEKEKNSGWHCIQCAQVWSDNGLVFFLNYGHVMLYVVIIGHVSAFFKMLYLRYRYADDEYYCRSGRYYSHRCYFMVSHPALKQS